MDSRRAEYGSKMVDDQVQIWRTLKNPTDGDGRKIMMSVIDEDRFPAWQKPGEHHKDKDSGSRKCNGPHGKSQASPAKARARETENVSAWAAQPSG